jgi:hypothetical protein
MVKVVSLEEYHSTSDYIITKFMIPTPFHLDDLVLLSSMVLSLACECQEINGQIRSIAQRRSCPLSACLACVCRPV